MRRIREILRLRQQQRLSVRDTAQALGVSGGVVSKTAARAAKAGVTWEVAEEMGDAALEERLYGRPPGPSDDRPRPDPVYIRSFDAGEKCFVDYSVDIADDEPARARRL